jgi:hypothetical protein
MSKIAPPGKVWSLNKNGVVRQVDLSSLPEFVKDTVDLDMPAVANEVLYSKNLEYIAEVLNELSL